MRREVLRGGAGLGGEGVGSWLGVDDDSLSLTIIVESSLDLGRGVEVLRGAGSAFFATFRPAFCAAPTGSRFRG